MFDCFSALHSLVLTKQNLLVLGVVCLACGIGRITGAMAGTHSVHTTPRRFGTGTRCGDVVTLQWRSLIICVLAFAFLSFPFVLLCCTVLWCAVLHFAVLLVVPHAA